jgi:hypothetical protein
MRNALEMGRFPDTSNGMKSKIQHRCLGEYLEVLHASKKREHGVQFLIAVTMSPASLGLP